MHAHALHVQLSDIRYTLYTCSDFIYLISFLRAYEHLARSLSTNHVAKRQIMNSGYLIYDCEGSILIVVVGQKQGSHMDNLIFAVQIRRTAPTNQPTSPRIKNVNKSVGKSPRSQWHPQMLRCSEIIETCSEIKWIEFFFPPLLASVYRPQLLSTPWLDSIYRIITYNGLASLSFSANVVTL